MSPVSKGFKQEGTLIFTLLLPSSKIDKTTEAKMKIFLIFLLICAFSCQHKQNRLRSNEAKHLNKPYVIMVSIDGYRHDYAKLHDAPFMKNIEKTGNYAPLKSVFPTKTFPNHVSLVTGLKAGHHGIVSNRFYDRKRKESYLIGNKKNMSDGSWYGGEPIWVAAHKQGMMSASFFWVGSDANIQNLYPTYYYPYNQSIPNERRVDQVIKWLKLPKAQRPHFLTLYFSDVDSAGHSYGPKSTQVKKAVQDIDSELKRLYRETNKLGLPVNFIFVSDHGMTKIKHNLYLSELITMDDAIMMEERGPFVHLYISDPQIKERAYRQLKKNKKLSVYKKGQFPKSYGYDHPDRTAELTLVMKPGYYLLEKPQAKKITGGTHGHDNKESRDMFGIFYAKGPSIKSKGVMKPIDNIHVYPFVMDILGLEVKTKIDGKREVLSHLLNHHM
jgi:predicted AlkP superfamily pyrophosphatase or phosphodiesterase